MAHFIPYSPALTHSQLHPFALKRRKGLEVVLETLLLEESKGPIPFVDPRLEGEVP